MNRDQCREGKTVCASLVSRELVREVRDYERECRNLASLGSRVEVARGKTAAVALPLAVAVKATEDERKPHLPGIRNIDRRNQAESNHGRTSSN